MDTFVVVINPDGSPDKLHGPFDWNHALNVLTQIVRQNNVPVSVEVAEVIEELGYYNFMHGGGVYLMKPSSLSDTE